MVTRHGRGIPVEESRGAAHALAVRRPLHAFWVSRSVSFHTTGSGTGSDRSVHRGQPSTSRGSARAHLDAPVLVLSAIGTLPGHGRCTFSRPFDPAAENAVNGSALAICATPGSSGCIVTAGSLVTCAPGDVEAWRGIPDRPDADPALRFHIRPSYAIFEESAVSRSLRSGTAALTSCPSAKRQSSTY